MQRLSIALLLMITLVAGIAAGNTFFRTAIPATAPGLAGGRETALAFYDALNQVLAGGNTGPLAAVLSPSFIDHESESGTSQSADDFLEHVRALGRTPNVARFTVDTIEESGNSLIVHLDWIEISPRMFAGVSIEQAGKQPEFEVLRLARGRIVDRWSTGILWFQASEFPDIELYAPGQTHLATTLVRIAIPAGVEYRWQPVAPGFLSIESGSAELHVKHATGDEETRAFEPGAATELTSGDRVQLRAVDENPVTALIHSIVRRSAAEVYLPASALHARSQGVTQSLLWSGTFSLTGDRTVHRPAWIALPAGSEIRIAGAAGATLVLAIDAGAIELVAAGGVISILGDDLRAAEHANLASIDAHRAASLAETAAVSIRNESEHSVTILLVVIENDTQIGCSVGMYPGPRHQAPIESCL